MESWAGKTKITTTRTKTQDTRAIHPKQCKEMLITRQKLQAHWEIRNNAIQEHAQQQETGKKGGTEYTKTAEKTAITHLVARQPEMPNALELNREGREQLAELVLEYPTRQDNQGEETMGGKRRYYTCLRCKKPFETPIAKTNHIGHSPECRQLPQKETFTNRCQERHRDFRGPSWRGEHRQYICTRQRKNAPDSENAHHEQADREIEQDQEQKERKTEHLRWKHQKK